MAAYAALASLFNTIEAMMTHPLLSTSFHSNQINSLKEKSALLLHFIQTYNYSGGSEEAQHLESQIASAAHTAEDMIESHIVNQILPLSPHDRESAFSFSLYLQKKRAFEERYTPAAHVAGDLNQSDAGSNQASLSCSQYLQQIIEDMDAIIQKSNELKEKERLKEEQPTHSTPLTQTGETAMVGFHDELIQLLDELTGQQSDRHIISIVGIGGMGKTTLAKNIYANQLIIERFDIRAWATVSQQYNAKDILQQLVPGHRESSDKDKTVNELEDQLHRTLFGRRYLIILDDIWSVEAWDEVSRFFPDNGNGSRIVLTTRLSDVANGCGSSCFRKNLLDENGSWELFCKKAFQQEDCPTELEEIGKEIVRLCKGLPLSIVVIGGSLLKSPRSLGYWKKVAKDIESSPDSKEKQESLDVLLSSYNHLPPYLKPCFLHIGVLKRINFAKLKISHIIQLWVAEGFLKSNGGRVLEEIAEDYLKDLIDRNLIVVGSRRKNGKMKCCDIHDILRDLCLKVAKQEGVFIVMTQGPVLVTERRLACINVTWGRENVRFPLARTIMESGFDKEDCDEHRLLRILHGRCDISVEESFGCVNLRYLALPKRYERDVWELPSSISLVWNLHALIFLEILWNKFRVIAPIEIWKMPQLRHIEFPEIYLPHPDVQDDELLIMENFQTLQNAVNLRLSEDVCKIIPNIKKLYLVYGRRFEGYDDSLIECLCNLDRLHKLESLKLIAENSWRQLDYEVIKILRFPSSLNKLCLAWCHFGWDDLTVIASLPRLQVLIVRCNFFAKGGQWAPVDGQFQHLKFLQIWYCDLRCWDADSCISQFWRSLFLVCCTTWKRSHWVSVKYQHSNLFVWLTVVTQP